MSNISNVLLPHGVAYDEDGAGRVANLKSGGTFGYAANITDWQNAQPYSRQQLIIILINIPGLYEPAYKYVRNPDEYALAFKAMFETQPKSVEGFGNKYTVNTSEYQMDATGAMFWETPVGTTIQRSQVTFTYASDKIGRPINTIIKHWIDHGIKNPHTRYALQHTYRQDSTDPTRDTLADIYSATYIAIQPDVSGKVCEEAFLVRNAFPKETPSSDHTRDMTQDIELEQISIPYAGLVVNNAQTKILGQVILNNIVYKGVADPYNVPIMHNKDDLSTASLDQIGGDHTAGYKESVDVTRPTGQTGNTDPYRTVV